MKKIDWFRTFIFLCMVALVFGSGYLSGTQYEAGARADHTRQALDTERQVLELVVRRNPGATIRDFAGFPGHLLAEAERHRIDFRLVLALIDHESEFNPAAVGKRGEVGLMQVLPATAELVCANRELACERPVQRALLDAKLNVTIGLAHLAGLRDEFGGMGAVALRGYNRGSSRAREDWPGDRYAERVAVKFVRVAHEVRP